MKKYNFYIKLSKQQKNDTYFEQNWEIKLLSCRKGPPLTTHENQIPQKTLPKPIIGSVTKLCFLVTQTNKEPTIIETIVDYDLWFISLSGSVPWRRCLCCTSLMEHGGPWKGQKSQPRQQIGSWLIPRSLVVFLHTSIGTSGRNDPHVAAGRLIFLG